MVAFLQLPCVLRGELFAVGIQDNDGWQTKSCGMAVFCLNVPVVILVHINHHNHVALLQFLGDVLVCLEKLVQLMARKAPVRPELKQ